MFFTLIIFYIGITLGCGLTFNCAFQYVTWNSIARVYRCSARVIQTDGPLQITGQHLQGRSDQDVEVFLVSFQELPQIPEGIESFFPNLIGFQIYMSRLRTVSKHVLKYPSLRTLRLSHNNLVTLDSDLFAYTSKLENIDFDSNSLQHIGRNLLTGVDKLTHADFSINPCIKRTAINRQQVLLLSAQLPISCPPAATTTAIPVTTKSTTAPATTTSIPISSTQSDLNAFCNQCEGQTIKIASELVEEQEVKFKDQINNLIKVNLAYDIRITELEKAMRETRS